LSSGKDTIQNFSNRFEHNIGQEIPTNLVTISRSRTV